MSIIPQKVLVLVVEDEPLLRMAAVDLVEEAGFEAIEADNADAAIRLLEARADIRIIFTDIDMPAGSMNGLKLAAAVQTAGRRSRSSSHQVNTKPCRKNFLKVSVFSPSLTHIAKSSGL